MRFLPAIGDLYKAIEKRLSGMPDFVLGLIMFAIAGVYLWGAFHFSSSMKAIAIAWGILP